MFPDYTYVKKLGKMNLNLQDRNQKTFIIKI